MCDTVNYCSSSLMSILVPVHNQKGLPARIVEAYPAADTVTQAEPMHHAQSRGLVDVCPNQPGKSKHSPASGHSGFNHCISEVARSLCGSTELILRSVVCRGVSKARQQPVPALQKGRTSVLITGYLGGCYYHRLLAFLLTLMLQDTPAPPALAVYLAYSLCKRSEHVKHCILHVIACQGCLCGKCWP